jgi:sulfide:quinone oxidoreductase
VGSGLYPKSDFNRPLASLVPNHISLIPENVKTFSPNSSSITTTSGRDIAYETLVIAAGLQINYDAIKGLPAALTDSNSGVSTIYSSQTCDKVWTDIENLKSGNAVFTQPSGIIKCAGGECSSTPIECYINEYSPTKNYVDGVGSIPQDREEGH